MANTSNGRNSANTAPDKGKYLNSLSAQLKSFFKELLDIRAESDRDATIEDVRKDISFKGHNAWILVFSIFVASIGLNVGNASVIIGAMLISPLLGPIVGVGLSIAINDVDTLKRSLINLAVMVVLSVLTAYFYFLISPIKQETPELIARTYPTVLDVLLAIFGGFALMVGKTQKGTLVSVILGVAIATALMPPLCTVGFGLAIGNWEYVGGAFYLFSINSVFIALSTYIVAKFLKFPLVEYADSHRRRKIARIATVVAVLVMIPSVVLFIKLLNQQVFMAKAEDFVEDVISYEGAEVIKFTQNYKQGIIDVFLIGEPVPQEKINEWIQELSERSELQNAILQVHQGSDQSPGYKRQLTSSFKADFLEEVYVKNQATIEERDAQIELLEEELSKFQTAGIPFAKISKEAKINYNDIEELSFANTIVTDFENIDTLPTFNIKWRNELSPSAQQEQLEKLQQWLQVRLSLDTLKVQTVN